MDRLLEELKKYESDTDVMLAILRDEILDAEKISEIAGYDVFPELANGPEFVIYYAAMYIKHLEDRA